MTNRETQPCASETNYFIASTGHTSDEAHIAWQRMYPGTRSFILERKDDEPFIPGRFLGSGGDAKVYETHVDGVPVALKQVNLRRNGCAQPWFESDILRKVSSKRHKHVVELIGSYLHHQRKRDVLGLILWPLAQFDLEHILEEFDALSTLRIRISADGNPNNTYTLSPDELYTVEDLSVLTSTPFNRELGVVGTDILALHVKSIRCLHTLFGCLAEAISYIHNDLGIRHRDLKPSQVLLSEHGIWLTDFGRAKDFSERSTSITDGGEGMTPKYHAPERATMGNCGRAEDIFALGCTYLEMAYRLYELQASKFLNPDNLPRFRYSEHLTEKDDWLAPFMKKHDARRSLLGSLIHSMLAHDPQDRPTVGEVIEILKKEFPDHYEFFGSCCSSGHQQSVATSTILPTSSEPVTPPPFNLQSERRKEEEAAPDVFVDAPEHPPDLMQLSDPHEVLDGHENQVGETAFLAFVRKFGSRHIELGRNEPIPFKPGRFLGSSPNSDVHEIKISGIRFARKRWYHRQNQKQQLETLKYERHKHLVVLVGSYVHDVGKKQEIGTILWPVAACDLAQFLEHTDALYHRICSNNEGTYLIESREDVDECYDILLELTGEHNVDPGKDDLRLYESSLASLRRAFGCSASGLSFLHQQGIQHGDIKPENVLFTSEGPLLTDFGFSGAAVATKAVISNETMSAAMYQPPEWVASGEATRSADIFSLGCVFLEMAAILTTQYQLEHDKSSSSWPIPLNAAKVPFYKDLEAINKHLDNLAIYHLHNSYLKSSTESIIFQPNLTKHRQEQLHALAKLLKTMLAVDAANRPSASTITATLSRAPFSRCHASDLDSEFCGSCCVVKEDHHSFRLSTGSATAKKESNRASKVSLARKVFSSIAILVFLYGMVRDLYLCLRGEQRTVRALFVIACYGPLAVYYWRTFNIFMSFSRKNGLVLK